jgi:hypothetical protein
MLYRDLVDMAIKSGVQPQRAYIYLASLGIKGEQTRQLLSDETSYGRPQKLAVNDNGQFILRVSICKSCGSLHLSKK